MYFLASSYPDQESVHEVDFNAKVFFPNPRLYGWTLKERAKA